MSFRPFLLRVLMGLTVLAHLASLPACSLVNPHVTWERPPSGGSTLRDGIDYANSAKDQYKKAVGDQAILANLMGIGLIPLGAAALGLGITDGSGTTIAALGLAGAAAYGTGTWLSSRPRQLIYIAGINAMTCAVEAMLPLAFSDDARKAFTADLAQLNASIGTFRQQVDTVTRLLGQVKKDVPRAGDIIAETESDLRTAEALLETARTTFASGTQLDREIERAGQMLISAVDRIGAEVDRAITTTIPDIQGLPSIVGGLAQTSAQFTKLPEVTKGGEQMTGKTEPAKIARDVPVAEERRPVEQLNEAKEQLRTQALALGERVRRVATVVNSVSETKPAATLKQCGVQEVVTGVSVQPVGPVEFEKGKAATKRLVITGGKPPYTAELLEDPVKGLTVKQPVPFGPRVVIEATTEAPPDTYTLLVTDAAGNTKTVAVRVK